MEKNEYNKMIATNASVIYAGALAGDNDRKGLITAAIEDAKLIAKLSGIPEPVDEHMGMGNSDYKHPST